MKKRTRNAALLVLAAAAVLAMVLLDDSIWGIMLAGWAMFFWAFTNAEPREIVVDARGLNPNDVKEYRRQHPEATLTEAINALGKPKK